MKKILKYTLFLILGIILFLGGFLFYSTLSDFQPEPEILILEPSDYSSISDSAFTVMTWNLGYAGLGSDMDFFYDGGKQVRTSEENTKRNLNQIINFIQLQKNVDFFLFQEVDVQAKRSYYINQRDTIEKVLPEYLSLFAENYIVDFVPVPFTEPMGSVRAGLQTAGKYIPTQSTRYSFPGNFDWPTRIFELDRCFMVNRYQLVNGKELLIINTHNSAFDDGTLKRQHLDYLIAFLKKEAEKGNYFVVGGDWNQNPPGLDVSRFGNHSDSESFILSMIDKDLFPNKWVWAFDPSTPTNRSNVKPYEKGKSSTTVLDFFLLSPNLKVNFITAIDLNFENSDHQPVIMSFELK
jgi:exonuclease III